MKFNIKLKELKNKFCKNCLTQLKGEIRIGKIYKTVICEKCKQKNRFRMQRNY